MVNDKEGSKLKDYFAAEYSPLFCLNGKSMYCIREVGQYPASLNMPKARL